ncbi:hypothetical protein [Cognatilysobacter tabacisoli]|uniref:hypothetical protein n=1 Tax=Cognatilysobacter tabacisoli TaxID=2315424 RepID=UPI000E6B1AEA|nr:hypothetical protein [Lysobacter tabacisoli]
MKIRYAIAALALCFATPAFAEDPISQLADATGLSERKVQMVLGTRSSFAEYRYTYDRALEQFRDAVGEEQYQRFVAGQPIDLEAVARARATAQSARTDVAARL